MHFFVRYYLKGEYSLSERGKSFMPVLSEICTWGHEHINDEI